MIIYKKSLKNKKSKKILERIDPELVDALLKLYMERCKFKHTLVFIQFRKLLPKAKLHDLMEIFHSRKAFFLDMIAKSEFLVNKQDCLKTGVIEPLSSEETDETTE
jgi:hypothetical protein